MSFFFMTVCVFYIFLLGGAVFLLEGLWWDGARMAQPTQSLPLLVLIS